MEVSRILKQYKNQDGSANYPELFKIPTHERLVALSQIDNQHCNLLIIGALTVAFEATNLKRGMNEMQILMLAETIIDSASEDNLALEDLILFLQYLIKGKYDLSYESMDIPKFMRLFEIYRQERHEAVLDYRYNVHYECRAYGDAGRDTKKNALADELGNIMERMGDKNERIKELITQLKGKNGTAV